MPMRRSGFTAIELMIVIILIGVIAAVGFPKMRDTLDKTNVRSARVAVGTYTVTARSLAVARGCRALVTRMIGRGQRSAVAAAYAGRRLEMLRASACVSQPAGSEVLLRGGNPVDSLTWSFTALGNKGWQIVVNNKYLTALGQWRSDVVETEVSCLL